MVTKPRVFSFSLIFLNLIFSGSLRALETKTLLETYSGLHEALAGDKVAEARTLAQKADLELAHGLKQPGLKQLELIQKMKQGAQQLSQSQTDEEARKAFGLYSEGMVSFIRDTNELKKQWQLFYCPMVPKGTYGYWIQPTGKSLLNPYYGSKMLTCGVKRPW